jgi:hypothetical protein
MGWASLTFRDGRPPLHLGDDNPNVRPVIGPVERARTKNFEPEEARWQDRHYDDPEVTEPGGDPYK